MFVVCRMHVMWTVCISNYCSATRSSKSIGPCALLDQHAAKNSVVRISLRSHVVVALTRRTLQEQGAASGWEKMGR